jgi:dephospho-CoA kinase
MAQLVFNNKDKLQQLNAIIHPLVAKHFKEWIKKNENATYVLKEAAILFETNGHISCDFIITVTAPLDVKINRVQMRDHLSKEEIIRRINTQWTDEQRIILSDFVIDNYSLKKTQAQVELIHKEILKSIQ